MVEEPDSENSLFSEPIKIRTLAALGAPEQIDHAALGLEVVEQRFDALQIVERMQILEQIGMAAHDQLPILVLAAGPARDSGRDDLWVS